MSYNRLFFLFSAFVLAACNSKTPDTPVLTEPADSDTQIQIVEEEVKPEFIAPVLKSIGPYTVDTARDCDGFPRLNLSTYSGLCVGLVATAETPAANGQAGLKFPRDIIFPNPEDQFSDEFYLTDMGGWGENKGRVLMFENGQFETVVNGLNLPHAIEYGPDNEIYIAEADQFIRFAIPPSKLDGFGYETVISGLPYKPGGQKHLHPLKAFTFSGSDTLWINSGSLSDRCLDSLPTGLCTEYGNSAAVLNFKRSGGNWVLNPDHIVRGLRNSMGLATHSSGTVLQVENGADFKEADSPYEEINRIDFRPGQPRFYGWPFCFDRDQQDPAWGPSTGYNCSTHNPDYMQPIALLPPHGAPLDLLYAPVGTLNFESEKLIIPLHGYRSTAHRILYFDVDEEGLPVGEASELVFDWAASETGPRGAPTGLTIGPDGAIWGVEDKNKTVFRIAVDQHPPQVWNGQAGAKAIIADDTYSILHAEILKPKCAACHDEFSGSPNHSINKLAALKWLEADSPLYKRLIAKPPKQMPPEKPLTVKEIESIKEWLEEF